LKALTETTSSPAPDFEAENQAMLRAYHAQSCTVVRNQKGEVTHAVMKYPDGRSELVHHCSSSAHHPGPAYVTSSQLSGETSAGGQ
jgi:hypothetical protein